MEVYILKMIRRWNDDPLFDTEEINAVFDSKEKAEKFGQYIISRPSIDSSKYVSYDIIDFLVL